MAPTQLKIATSSLKRLVDEEASYHKELASQEKRIAELERSTDDQDGNREYTLKQEVRFLTSRGYSSPLAWEKVSQQSRRAYANVDIRDSIEESARGNESCLPIDERAHCECQRETTGSNGTSCLASVFSLLLLQLCYVAPHFTSREDGN